MWCDPASSGVWSKDPAASDSKGHEAMLDVLGLSGLPRTTARLIDGVEIDHTPGKSFDVTFLTIVPFFRVTESVPISGGGEGIPGADSEGGRPGAGQRQPRGKVAKSTMMRRDLKPGRQSAYAGETPSSNSVSLNFEWGAPDAGMLQEVYMMDLVGGLITNKMTTDRLTYAYGKLKFKGCTDGHLSCPPGFFRLTRIRCSC